MWDDCGMWGVWLGLGPFFSLVSFSNSLEYWSWTLSVVFLYLFLSCSV